MNKGHLLAAAGGMIASALIGGALISSVLAAPSGPGHPDGTASYNLGNGRYCEVYLDALAAELGVERATLGAASKAALNAVIDAAVADDTLDEARATEARDRIAELEDAECEAFRARIGSHHGHGHGHGPGALGGRGFGALRDAVDAAAGALGMEHEDLVAAFREGRTLQELAEAQGVAYDTVTTAVTAAVRARLDDAVADEDITQERAGKVLERLGDWLEDGGEPLRHGPRGGGPFGG